MDLGDRMKWYEAIRGPYLMPYVPAFIRVDGRAFHTWTKGLQKPFDKRLSDLMAYTAYALMKEFGGIFAYTQSDEISIILYQRELTSQFSFNGSAQKLDSIAAAYTTAIFNKFNTLNDKLATFDGRSCSLPNETEAANYIVWRERDAVRNSLQGLAQANFSHKELQRKNCSQMHEMLMAKNINWANLPDEQKRGRFFTKQGEIFPGRTCEELEDVIFGN